MGEDRNFSRQKVPLSRIPHTIVAKWSAEVLDEGFVPFPKRLLRCLPAIFDGPNAMEDLAVVLSVVDYKRPNLTRWPSMEFLAFVAGMDVERFEARLRDLEKRELIETHGEPDGLHIELDGILDRVEKLTHKRRFDEPS